MCVCTCDCISVRTFFLIFGWYMYELWFFLGLKKYDSGNQKMEKNAFGRRGLVIFSGFVADPKMLGLSAGCCCCCCIYDSL